MHDATAMWYPARDTLRPCRPRPAARQSHKVQARSRQVASRWAEIIALKPIHFRAVKIPAVRDGLDGMSRRAVSSTKSAIPSLRMVRVAREKWEAHWQGSMW